MDKKIYKSKEDCCGCTACYPVCPVYVSGNLIGIARRGKRGVD